MSNFVLTFYKKYIYAKGWPGINLGASHESCAHPNIDHPCIDTRELKVYNRNSFLKLWLMPLRLEAMTSTSRFAFQASGGLLHPFQLVVSDTFFSTPSLFQMHMRKA